MFTAIGFVVSYIALGIITGLIVYKVTNSDITYDSDIVFLAFIFWPLFVIYGLFWIPYKILKYLSEEIIPAKKKLNGKRVTFQKVINLIEEMPIEDFEEYSWNGLKLRQRKGGKVCSDWLYFYYNENCWYIYFSDLHFDIPDSIFFRKEVSVLKKKYREFREFKERKKYGDDKYNDIISQIRENSNL